MENVLVAHKMFYRMFRYAEYVGNYSKMMDARATWIYVEN